MRRLTLTLAAAVISLGVLSGCTSPLPTPAAVPQVVVESEDPTAQPPDPAEPATPSASAAVSASGSWQGYWTWVWTGGKWVATWTWVWVPTGGTFQPS
jgi:hypothetical protein